MTVLSTFQKLLMMGRIESLKTAVFGLWLCKAEQRFFFFFILIVYLQNRFQQLKSIYGLMEKAAVGGFLALKEWEPHQWQREESMDYAHKAGQGAQGKQGWLTGVCRVLFQRAWQCLQASRLRRANTVFQFCAENRLWEAPYVCGGVCCLFKGLVSWAYRTVYRFGSSRRLCLGLRVRGAAPGTWHWGTLLQRQHENLVRRMLRKWLQYEKLTL